MIDKNEIKRLAAGRYGEILAHVGPLDEQYLDGRHHPCPKCGGIDRFRVDISKEFAICNGCFDKHNADIIAAVQWLRECSFPEALKLLADYLGITNGRAPKLSIIEQVCRAKGIPSVDSLKVFGAEEAKDKYGKPCVSVPVYDERRQPCSHFDMNPRNKGYFRKGRDAGLFFPGRTPTAGETWYVCEGCKDAAALYSIGLTNACGLNTDHLAQKFVKLFAGCHVILIPDRTEDAERKAIVSAKRLHGVAASVHIVMLPLALAGKDEPDDVRDVLKKQDGEKLLRDAIAAARPWEPPKSESGLDTIEGRTDCANAGRLLQIHGQDLKYIGPWKRWLIWDGKRWLLDGACHIERRAKDVPRTLFDELARFGGGDAEMFRFCKRSANRNGIQDMIALARCEVAIHHDDLDRDKWLFNIASGTVDLRTGRIREHNRADLITALSAVSYDADADCPLWQAFLDRIFMGDLTLIGYMQRLVGYCLTGEIREHVLPVLYGTGANGKSTLVNAIQALLGPDYSMKAPPELLIIKKHDSHPTERADLFRKRFVASVETERGRRLAESLTKELTGGDRIRARRMQENFWEFAPTHKVCMATNHKPIIRGTDDGIWRRVKLIPFEVTIPTEEQDHDLGRKLETELPGILNWAIQGCRDWRDYGLDEPKAVTLATDAYKTESDDLGQFIDDCCFLGEDCECPATVLHEAYCRAVGKVSIQHFANRMINDKGFDRRRITSGPHKGRMVYLGIALRHEFARENEVSEDP